MKETARHPQDAGPLSSTVGGFTRSWTRTLSLSHCSGLQCTEEITGEGVLQCLNTAEYLPGQMGSKGKAVHARVQWPLLGHSSRWAAFARMNRQLRHRAPSRP